MYGLVNKAIQELICQNHGQDTWERIRKAAGVSLESFVSMQAYPDELTYELVGAASRELSLPVPALLEAFGQHWVHYTGKAGYGELMGIAGTSFVEFLQELDNMHARVAMTFPKLRPPSFECTDIGPRSVRLHYHSEREGLAPMVLGLVRGLGEIFAVEGLVVEHDVRRDSGADHDEFAIRWGEA